jgi:hypothetical protein
MSRSNRYPAAAGAGVPGLEGIPRSDTGPGKMPRGSILQAKEAHGNVRSYLE